MDSASLSSIIYFGGIGLFITAGITSMLGLPYYVLQAPQGRISGSAVGALILILCLTILGAAGVALGAP